MKTAAARPPPEGHEPFSGNRDKLESKGRATRDEFFNAEPNGPAKESPLRETKNCWQVAQCLIRSSPRASRRLGKTRDAAKQGLSLITYTYIHIQIRTRPTTIKHDTINSGELFISRKTILYYLHSLKILKINKKRKKKRKYKNENKKEEEQSS